ncbi:protein SFI1 [Mytilus galloprovincialis]|uniref:Protein SFI1 n=1 Tax=Mytilus galloprovincialis TaxID=29158 RepID=A0A8B6BEJ5_MYTGA|nr:protein SFI1 [Mytilus galloprovincialis]
MKEHIQQIVVPQNPISMNDLLTKAVTAEMTVNMKKTNNSSVEETIHKAISSLENSMSERLANHFQSVAAITTPPQNNKQEINNSSAYNQQMCYNPYQQPFQNSAPNYANKQNGPCKGCVGSTKFTQTVHVLDQLHHTLILGFDFMKNQGAFINFDDLTLEMNKPKMIIGSISIKAGLVRTIKAVTIPKRSEINIPVSVSRQTHDSTVLLEPLESYCPALKNLVVAKCLVNVQNGKACLRLLNPTHSDIQLKAHKEIAKVSQVNIDDIYPLDDNTKHTCISAVSTTNIKQKDTDLHFDLSNSCLTSDEKSELSNFLQKNRSAFATSLNELGCTHLYKHNIETVPGARPVRLNPYRQPPNVRDEQDRQVQELQESGIIEPSSSSWAFPVVMCFKRSGGSMRMAIDYRKLNSLCLPQSFPLPHMESVFDAIGENKAKYFSSLDLKSGYYQVPLTEESKPKTAFITQTGVYQFKRMSFGLMNAPITFQAMMSDVLRGLNWKFVLVYVDDILVFSKNFQDHLNHLSQVFERLKHANLKLHPDKCHFAMKEIKFLGHYISQDGVKLTQKRPELLTNFQYLKPRNSKPFILTCDASDEAISFVLGQLDFENKEYVVAYGNKTLTKEEKRYNTSEKECLAILKGVETYRPYLANSHFTVVTDHSALVWLKSAKHTGRLARWALRMQDLQFSIIHRPGKSNVVADCLSRIPNPFNTDSVQAISLSKDILSESSDDTESLSEPLESEDVLSDAEEFDEYKPKWRTEVKLIYEFDHEGIEEAQNVQETIDDKVSLSQLQKRVSPISLQSILSFFRGVTR